MEVTVKVKLVCLTSILACIQGPMRLAWAANWRLSLSWACWRAISSWRAPSRWGTSFFTWKTHTRGNTKLVICIVRTERMSNRGQSRDVSIKCYSHYSVIKHKSSTSLHYLGSCFIINAPTWQPLSGCWLCPHDRRLEVRFKAAATFSHLLRSSSMVVVL